MYEVTGTSFGKTFNKELATIVSNYSYDEGKAVLLKFVHRRDLGIGRAYSVKDVGKACYWQCYLKDIRLESIEDACRNVNLYD